MIESGVSEASLALMPNPVCYRKGGILCKEQNRKRASENKTSAKTDPKKSKYILITEYSKFRIHLITERVSLILKNTAERFESIATFRR